MNSEYPQNRTEAANTIFKLLKEFWGDCVSVKISASNREIDFEIREKPFTVITRYGRRIELAFDYCPKCGRRIKPFDEDLLEERD